MIAYDDQIENPNIYGILALTFIVTSQITRIDNFWMLRHNILSHTAIMVSLPRDRLILLRWARF